MAMNNKTVAVGDMSWNEMRELVNNRLKRLQMCKMGSIATDINKQVEALGPKPSLTKEDRAKIKEGLAAKVKKAMTPTLAMIRRLSVSDLAHELRLKGAKVVEGAYIHPDLKEWEAKIKMLQEQERAREAQCEADFQDTKDCFALKVFDISQFPAEYEKLEVREW